MVVTSLFTFSAVRCEAVVLMPLPHPEDSQTGKARSSGAQIPTLLLLSNSQILVVHLGVLQPFVVHVGNEPVALSAFRHGSEQGCLYLRLRLFVHTHRRPAFRSPVSSCHRA